MVGKHAKSNVLHFTYIHTLTLYPRRGRDISDIPRDTHILSNVLASLVWCPGQNKRIAPFSLFHGCRKRQLKD
jgi:hypothetical protein